MVEQTTVNRLVVGSIPTVPATFTKWRVSMIDYSAIEKLHNEFISFLDSTSVLTKKDFSVYTVYDRGRIVEQLSENENKPVFSLFKKKYDGTDFQVVCDVDEEGFNKYCSDYGEKFDWFFLNLKQELFRMTDTHNEKLFEKARIYSPGDSFASIAETFEDLLEILS